MHICICIRRTRTYTVQCTLYLTAFQHIYNIRVFLGYLYSVFTNLPDEYGRAVQWYLVNGDASVRYCTVVSSFTKVPEHMAIYNRSLCT